MPKTVTFAELKTRVRFLGDFENSRVISDARLGEVVNASVESLWDLLLRHRPDAYVVEAALVPTVPGSNSIALPASFYRLRLVEVQDGTKYRRLHPHNLSEAWRIEGDGTSSPRRMRYRIQGGVLRLAPTPTAVFQIRVHYLPVATTLVADGDTLDSVNGYEDLIIADAIVQLKLRESMPFGEWEARADKLRAEIIEASSDLDAGEAFLLSGGVDTYEDDDLDAWGGG